METTIRIKRVNIQKGLDHRGPVPGDMNNFLNNVRSGGVDINYEIPVEKFITILYGEMGWFLKLVFSKKRLSRIINKIINNTRLIESKYAEKI